MGVIHLDYDTIREDYNVYEIENGQILKSKVSVVDFIEKDEAKGGTSGQLGFMNISEIYTTKPIDTSDLKESTQDKVTDDDVVKELKFTIKKESINIYESANLFLLVGDRVEKIMLTNKKNNKGDPIVRYRIDMGVNVVPKIQEKV